MLKEADVMSATSSTLSSRHRVPLTTLASDAASTFNDKASSVELLDPATPKPQSLHNQFNYRDQAEGSYKKTRVEQQQPGGYSPENLSPAASGILHQPPSESLRETAINSGSPTEQPGQQTTSSPVPKVPTLVLPEAHTDSDTNQGNQKQKSILCYMHRYKSTNDSVPTQQESKIKIKQREGGAPK
jgi:hypothetical protein